MYTFEPRGENTNPSAPLPCSHPGTEPTEQYRWSDRRSGHALQPPPPEKDLPAQTPAIAVSPRGIASKEVRECLVPLPPLRLPKGALLSVPAPDRTYAYTFLRVSHHLPEEDPIPIMYIRMRTCAPTRLYTCAYAWPYMCMYRVSLDAPYDQSLPSTMQSQHQS